MENTFSSTVSNYQFPYWKVEKIVNFTIWEALVYAVHSSTFALINTG
jgi:hypothetical protein